MFAGATVDTNVIGAKTWPSNIFRSVINTYATYYLTNWVWVLPLQVWKGLQLQ